MDAQRALLDQLMGENRDQIEDEEVKRLDWRSERICKFYLSGVCPYSTFSNTKADIGRCSLEHSDKAAKLFQETPRYEQRPYDSELVSALVKIISDLER